MVGVCSAALAGLGHGVLDAVAEVVFTDAGETVGGALSAGDSDGFGGVSEVGEGWESGSGIAAGYRGVGGVCAAGDVEGLEAAADGGGEVAGGGGFRCGLLGGGAGGEFEGEGGELVGGFGGDSYFLRD